MKTLHIQMIGTEETLWWVYITTKRGPITHFEGDVFSDVMKANEYYDMLEEKLAKGT